MKKLLTLFLVFSFLLLCSSLYAQEMRLNKGQVELGGDVGFGMTSYSWEDGDFFIDNTSTITFYPRVGYFVIPNLEIEPRLIFNYVKWNYEGEGTEDESFTTLGAILNLVYNFEMEGKVIPFVFGGLGFQSYSSDPEPDEDYETTMILPDVGAGIKAFLTDNGVIRAELFYERHDKASGVDKLTTNNFGIRAGFSVFLK